MLSKFYATSVSAFGYNSRVTTNIPALLVTSSGGDTSLKKHLKVVRELVYRKALEVFEGNGSSNTSFDIIMTIYNPVTETNSTFFFVKNLQYVLQNFKPQKDTK